MWTLTRTQQADDRWKDTLDVEGTEMVALTSVKKLEYLLVSEKIKQNLIR